jgi:hypothetical protein
MIQYLTSIKYSPLDAFAFACAFVEASFAAVTSAFAFANVSLASANASDAVLCASVRDLTLRTSSECKSVAFLTASDASFSISGRKTQITKKSVSSN